MDDEADAQHPDYEQPPDDQRPPDWVPDRVPEEWEIEGPAVCISLGDAADLDPALLAAVAGPDGLGGNALCSAYEQDAAADVLRPGPVLSARADQALAAAAPGLRQDQLARKAAALEMKLDPQAARDRKERAARDRRVEVRREASGNASLAGRELPAADAMASKAHLDAVAARLRRAGIDGTLDHLRALALTELTQGRDPLSSLIPSPGTPDAPGPAAPAPSPGDPGPDAPEDPWPDGPASDEPAPDPGAPAPSPAVPRPSRRRST
jgi:hypothetical protein